MFNIRHFGNSFISPRAVIGQCSDNASDKRNEALLVQGITLNAAI
jgi:hypothetical protein